MSKKKENKMYTEEEIAKWLQGRNENQQKIIRYFLQTPEPDGCFSQKPLLTHHEYRELRDRNALKFSKELVLEKLCIDASEVAQIKPVCLVGHLWDWGADRWYSNEFYSSLYQVTWLLFSVEQLYVYQFSFNTTSNFVSEKSEEYFYKDVTSFSTETDSHGRVGFKIVVPGDQFCCAIDNGDDNTMKSIQGMKSILRDKKRQ